MPSFRIFETQEFLKKPAKVPAADGEFIQRTLDEYVYPQLKEEPFFGANIKKLRGYTPDIWRYRIGKFRMFYVVDTEERVVYVLTVDLRRDVYR